MDILSLAIFALGLYALASVVKEGGGVEQVLADITGQSMLPMSQYSPAIQLFAQAIASAEGFGVLGDVPYRAHNPGDLSKGDIGDTGSYMIAGGTEYIIVFPDDATGWSALCEKLHRIVAGTSQIYSLSMTIEQFGMTYSGGDPNWALNVSNFLGVSSNTPLSEVLS